jgi:hypothetical protein
MGGCTSSTNPKDIQKRTLFIDAGPYSWKIETTSSQYINPTVDSVRPREIADGATIFGITTRSIRGGQPIMAKKVCVLDKVDVWAGTIEDRPGGLAEKLEAIALSGASLQFVIARRQPERPGRGVVFVAPISGAATIRAAKKAGMVKADNMFSLRLEGPDSTGLAALIARTLAGDGINIRGFSGAALGGKCVFYFAFDSKADQTKAARVLKKTLCP